MLFRVLVVAFFCSFTNANFAQTDAASIKAKFPVKVIAHRGASGYAPENTLASFQKAIELKANYVELDVHLSKDGEVVVIHDATLDRTTSGTGKVNEYSLAELKMLNASKLNGENYRDEKIPTLDEALKLTKGNAILLIEIKADADSKPYPDIEKKVLEIIQANKAEDWCEIQSFYDFSVNSWLELNTAIHVHKLLVGRLQPLYIDHKIRFGRVFKKYDTPQGINPYRAFAKRKMIKKIHRQNHIAYVWTVNDEKDIRKILKRNPDGIITNYPDRVLKLLSGEPYLCKPCLTRF